MQNGVISFTTTNDLSVLYGFLAKILSNQNTFKVKITITGVDSDKGKLRVVLSANDKSVYKNIDLTKTEGVQFVLKSGNKIKDYEVCVYAIDNHMELNA